MRPLGLVERTLAVALGRVDGITTSAGVASTSTPSRASTWRFAGVPMPISQPSTPASSRTSRATAISRTLSA